MRIESLGLRSEAEIWDTFLEVRLRIEGLVKDWRIKLGFYTLRAWLRIERLVEDWRKSKLKKPEL